MPLTKLANLISTNLELINPRRACAARVTVVVRVCPASEISPLERLLVLIILSRTQRTTKVKKYVGFSMKRLRCGDPALLPLNGHMVSHFPAENAHAHFNIYHVVPLAVSFFLCGGAEKVFRFVSCRWSCLQARSVHNVMQLYI